MALTITKLVKLSHPSLSPSLGSLWQGLVAFGESVLKAKDLHTTIQYMHQHNMYAKLVFYLEACESGSMFKVRPHRYHKYTDSPLY